MVGIRGEYDNGNRGERSSPLEEDDNDDDEAEFEESGPKATDEVGEDVWSCIADEGKNR